ncbi:VOC family protein [Thalassomonas actiniarum]|uniref:VOC family protein n=1 Tax=Thalassomonas actiniarum TaxID=485447 RepID=A0AAF0C1Y0_9GAMM|nr:VOC family protein [Thalassomonas actiniarum]WDD97418.1 VOC family protein [Thalassomonas actiniarum]
MSDFNTRHNRAVWFDIPVADLIRAASFYSKVLAVKVDIMEEEGVTFAVLEHGEGNGGCLVPNEEEISAKAGIMLYLNVDGRLRDAVSQVSAHGGKVITDIHGIGPYGFRAIIHDSEGNRLVLHSESDA